jgi:hypothetical protein
MELRAQRHCVDNDRFFVWVIVEDDNLEQSARSVSANDEVSVDARDNAQGMAKCVLHVFVANAVLSRAVRDLHLDKVALSGVRVKLCLSAPRICRLPVSPTSRRPGTGRGGRSGLLHLPSGRSQRRFGFATIPSVRPVRPALLRSGERGV